MNTKRRSCQCVCVSCAGRRGTAPAAPAIGIPRPLTSFFGRRAEIAGAKALLAQSRLVTITGPGGAGKTRLAREVAVEWASLHPGGVWWVDLAAVTDGAAVAETIAGALGVPLVAEYEHAICAFFGASPAMLCLDNAEHLLDSAAQLVEAMLLACPHVVVLTTSREPLGIPGEAILAVPPLSDDDAVSLFVDRARLVQQSFALDPTNEAAIRSIVRHLDGIPLALELAAAWVTTLGPHGIEAGLDDRFALLVRGPRGAQRRQRTLAGSIDWSHALLDEVDRTVFRRLSVFSGTFGLDVAQALCAGGTVSFGDVLPAIARLVDKSLLVAEEVDGTVRYRMLETIRAYATARLSRTEGASDVRERHLGWYLRLAERLDDERERDADRWRRTLWLEYDNLSAALEFGLAAQDPAPGRELAAAMVWFWHFDRRGREGIRFLQRAVDRVPDDRSVLQARLLTGVALVADTASPLDVEHGAARRAVDLAVDVGDEWLHALGLNLLAVGTFYTNLDEAWSLCEEAYAAAVASDNTFVLGGTRALQAMILHLRDRHIEAEAIVDEPVRSALQHHPGILSTMLTYQAEGALATGDPQRAAQLARQALQQAEPLGDYLRVGLARSVLARVLAATGDTVGATEVLDPVLRLIEGVQEEAFVPGLDHAAGELALRRGDSTSALIWFERAAASTERGTSTWIAARALPRLGTTLAAAGRTAEALSVLDRADAIAQTIGLPATLAEAVSARAEVVRESDDVARALDLHHDALNIRVAHGLRATQLDSLEAISTIGASTRASPDDARMLSAAGSARALMGFARTTEQQSAFDSAIVLLRSALGDHHFDQAWVEGRDIGLDQAVQYARRSRGSRGRPAKGWPSLTPTEIEVVQVIAEGLSNPQIAARLFMSRSTVKTHLSHIFAKLDIASRAELAAAAAGGLSGRWDEDQGS
jgi:predicted ATPase/DNA-binding CsgD family transcriptional regulator